MKVGIYGGTFDPVHIAHLLVAEYASSELALDTLFFVPSFSPPHKQSVSISSHHHRLNMVELAIGENRNFAVSDYEIKKQDISL